MSNYKKCVFVIHGPIISYYKNKREIIAQLIENDLRRCNLIFHKAFKNIYINIETGLIFVKSALSVKGWPHCLTIVSLCSNIIVDIPSIVPLYKNEKKNLRSRYAMHALMILTGNRERSHSFLQSIRK